MKAFILNGNQIITSQLSNNELSFNSYTSFEKGVLTFIKNWLSGQKEFTFQTSGSTGIPKMLSFNRLQLIKSAQRTIETFKLKAGDKVLMCLSPQYVAGKMMIVRAMEGNLELIVENPSSNPLSNLSEKTIIDFAAFTPYQIEHILNASAEKLKQIKSILIGGSDLHPNLESILFHLSSSIYHSYAMTETLSHVALRKINGKTRSNYYQAINGVKFEQDNRNCLIINDQILGIEKLITNDIVELLNDKSFLWKGRYDNIINTGGIKVHVEKAEQEIGIILNEMGLKLRYCVISQTDPKLTNRMILLIEKGKKEIDKQNLLDKLKTKLPKYHAPRKIILCEKIIHTKTGKIDRIANAHLYLPHS